MMVVGVTLLIFYSFMESHSEQLKVVGLEASLDAVAGENLVLPCFIKPNTSAVDMTVEWLRIEEMPLLVHLYRDYADRYEKQTPSYRGRTSLFKEELQKGNASLKLSPVRVSDEGVYMCLIKDKSCYDDMIVYIRVEAQGSHPVIMMESYDNLGGVNLVCESRGWNPEPDVLWLNSEGDPLPAEETQIDRDTEGFSVKRRITVHDYSDSNKFYCRLQQKHHMMETEVIINSKVFEAWKWDVGISLSACLITLGAIITAVICYSKASELQKVEKYAELLKKKLSSVDVTLDPDTAHPRLRVSADGKQMTRLDTRQENLTDTPERFDFYLCVVGKQSFSSGRFYYEVQVRGNTRWTLGVMRESVTRKWWIIERPRGGLWTVALARNQYSANADPSVRLTLREKVEKVGVFVDYEEGLVSFYDVESRSHIYSFTGQLFTEKLFPYFRTLDNNPLIIPAVTE
ncbi:butyrophilin subfamily 1 member A1-like [Clarias gariepinus]|uniref:butyrophilin subfamily 1 member A1-like n=1 Tax=Clarias gariepinus TaxID=13013 RepID=UPI00234C0F9D|nr:butyrophilin subfamily 1 member A1-like [Clarias gariepinus]